MPLPENPGAPVGRGLARVATRSFRRAFPLLPGPVAPTNGSTLWRRLSGQRLTPCNVVKADWKHLQSLAAVEVQTTLASLPTPLRRQATPLPVSYERAPNAAILADGSEPDLLGLFIGPPLAEPESSPLPSQIILFLENLWDFSEHNERIFREEVRTTYLHELGHYLGLDEIDLEERGLE